jgi:hypothetical protein
MAPPTLTPADHEHFIDHGYVVLRGAVPPETIAAALVVLEGDPADRGRGADAVAACATDVMLDAIDEIFGAGYTLTRGGGGSDMPRPHQPDGPWPDPTAHVDDSYPTTMPNGWAVGSFIFLTPVRSHGGAFICFPGSFRRYREVMARSCHSIKGAAMRPETSGPAHEFLAEPGDVLLFHHLAGHTGSNNVVDPRTRHALLTRWHPRERIVPGRKSYDDMTTIEKVNSARYLAHRDDIDMKVPSPVTDNAAGVLREGFADWNRVRTQAILHYDGCAHLLFVDCDEPAVVRRLVSDDGLDWRDAGCLALDTGEVCALHLHQYGVEAILGVTTTSGSVHLLTSTDMANWQPQARLDGVATATPWFVYAQYPSKVAGGQAVYFVPGDDSSRVLCRWGDRWQDAGHWETESLALRAPDGGCTITDVTIAAHFADSSCTFVVDVQDANAAVGDTRPWFVQPKDVAVADEPLQPLPFECPTPPKQLSIYNRARRYWLVTYRRETNGCERLFWGHIDWAEPTPTLRGLTTAAAFDTARCIVGFV